MIAIRELPEVGVPLDVFEGSLLLPIPERGTSSILFEERDGKHVLHLTAKALVWTQGGRKVMSVSKRKIDVWVTDARVAIACVKYEKGRFWWGFGGCGAIFAVFAIMVSAIRAAVRRHGKVLVGQIRYPWLRSVGSTTKVDWKSVECLVFTTVLPNHVEGRLTLTMNPSGNAAGTAAEIVRRAATYRLASASHLSNEERAALEELARADPLTPKPSPSADHATFFPPMPAAMPVGPDSARVRPA